MSLGEKIQGYRKNLGLSQEELGQKLLVSRQTISLWEKDQTVPTIENLVRLKEIFSVSVDEMLDVADATIQEELPTEIYTFQYNDDDYKKLKRKEDSKIYKSIFFDILFFAIAILFFEYSISVDEMTGSWIGFVLLYLCARGFAHYKYFKNSKKAWQAIKERTKLCVYEYKLYDYYVILNIYRAGEQVRKSKYYYYDFERIRSTSNYLIFETAGQAFTIRKSDLKENSFFYSYMYQNPAKTVVEKMPEKWQLLSTITFAGSILSIYLALFLVVVLMDGAPSNNMPSFMWAFFLVTPIPISSIIVGHFLKKKGYKYKKNIVAGVIMTVILCIYGSFVFVF